MKTVGACNEKFVGSSERLKIFIYLTAQQAGGSIPQTGVEETAVSGMRQPIVISESLGEPEGGTGEGILL